MSRNWSRGVVVVLAVVAVLAWLSLSRLLAPNGPLPGLVDAVETFTTYFLSLFIEGAAFLLLGCVASGLLEVFVDGTQVRRWATRGAVWAVLVGAGLGLFFPVGPTGVVPLTRRLLRKGLPLPAAVACLLAAPVVNPVVFASTLAAFGPGRVLVLRLGLTWLSAVAVGLLFAGQASARWLRPAPPEAGRHLPTAPGLTEALTMAVDEFFELGALLVAGALAAALLQSVVPQGALLALGTGPVRSVPALVVLATIQSAGAAADAFTAQALAGAFPLGALLAYLVLGPLLDLKRLALLADVFRWPMVACLVLAPLAINLAVGLVLNGMTR
jgi:uncharacterized protein